MTVTANLLLKVNRALNALNAAQPPDPLARLTDVQRRQYQDWWARFKTDHDEKPFDLYAAWIAFEGWTPDKMLPRRKITRDMTVDQAANAYHQLVLKKV